MLNDKTQDRLAYFRKRPDFLKMVYSTDSIKAAFQTSY